MDADDIQKFPVDGEPATAWIYKLHRALWKAWQPSATSSIS